MDAYGFMSEEFKKYSNYYYDKYVKTRVVFYSNHDYIQEKMEKHMEKPSQQQNIKSVPGSVSKPRTVRSAAMLQRQE